jgi:hypothetical protein
MSRCVLFLLTSCVTKKFKFMRISWLFTMSVFSWLFPGFIYQALVCFCAGLQCWFVLRGSCTICIWEAWRDGGLKGTLWSLFVETYWTSTLVRAVKSCVITWVICSTHFCWVSTQKWIDATHQPWRGCSCWRVNLVNSSTTLLTP